MAGHQKGLRLAVRTVSLALALVPALMSGSASALLTQVEPVSAVSAETASAKQITVSCPAGKRVVGAGADVTPGAGDVLIDAVRPNATLTRVTARARPDEDGSPQAWFIAAYAICAPAPDGLELVTATSASSSANKSVVAACPGGKRLLGTGGEITSANGQVLLDGLLPSSNLTQATVNALEDETGNPGAWTVTAYAICSAPVTGLERTSVASGSDSGSPKVLAVPCAAGKVLLSVGGTINSANGQVVLDAAFPHADLAGAGFAAWEDDTGNAGNWSLTAYAVCAANVVRDALGGPKAQVAAQSFARPCPAGRRTTGVGAELTGGVGQHWIQAISTAGNNFFAAEAADETGSSAPVRLTSYGICASGLDSVVVPADSASTSDASQAIAAVCPAGMRVIGAGGHVKTKVGSESQVVLDTIRPDPTLTFVTVAGQEDASGYFDVWELSAYAICAPPPPGLQLVQRAARTTSEEFATTTATCPPGKHLIGTGAEIVGGLGRVGFDDIRPDALLTKTTVTATEGEAELDAGWKPIAYSICIDR